MIQRFSSLGIIPGGDPVNNAAILRSSLVQGAALLADDSPVPYNFSTVAGALEFAFNGLSILAESPRVAFLHTSTGRFLSFNGQATLPSSDAAKEITFGGSYPIKVLGNPAGGTTDALYVNKLADCQFKARMRNAQSFLRIDGVGQPVPIQSQIGAVLCRFDITASPDWDNQAYAIPSKNGVNATNAYNNQFRVNIEGSGFATDANPAVYFNYSNRNKIEAGSSAESNGEGGYWFSSTCDANNIDANDCEMNGTSFYDLVVRGSKHVFTNFAGKAEINGIINQFIGCDLQGAVVNTWGQNSRHIFIGCDLTGWNDISSCSMVRDCTGAADKN